MAGLIDLLDSRVFYNGRSLLPGCIFLRLLAVAVDAARHFFVGVVDGHAPMAVFSIPSFRFAWLAGFGRRDS